MQRPDLPIFAGDYCCIPREVPGLLLIYLHRQNDEQRGLGNHIMNCRYVSFVGPVIDV